MKKRSNGYFSINNGSRCIVLGGSWCFEASSARCANRFYKGSPPHCSDLGLRLVIKKWIKEKPIWPELYLEAVVGTTSGLIQALLPEMELVIGGMLMLVVFVPRQKHERKKNFSHYRTEQTFYRRFKKTWMFLPWQSFTDNSLWFHRLTYSGKEMNKKELRNRRGSCWLYSEILTRSSTRTRYHRAFLDNDLGLRIVV